MERARRSSISTTGADAGEGESVVAAKLFEAAVLFERVVALLAMTGRLAGWRCRHGALARGARARESHKLTRESSIC